VKIAKLIKAISYKDGELASNQVIMAAVIKVLENGAGASGETKVKVKNYYNNKAWLKGNWGKYVAAQTG
jgi:hypothetical protein